MTTTLKDFEAAINNIHANIDIVSGCVNFDTLAEIAQKEIFDLLFDIMKLEQCIKSIN